MGFKDRFRDIQPFAAEAENEIIPEEKTVFPFFDILLSKLSDKVYSIPIWFDYSKEEKKELINLFVLNFLKDSSISLPHDSRESLINELTASVFGFGEIDKLLADNAVSALSIKSGQNVFVKKSGETIDTGMKIENVDILAQRLFQASKLKTDRPVLKFGFENLIVTLIMPPVCDYFITIKKKTREHTDFAYLLQNNKIDESIYSFLISLLNDKKNILISGAAEAGKTSYIEAICASVQNSVLFQKTKFINSESFICGGLSSNELENLFSALTFSDYDYVIFDLNDGSYKDEISGIISSIQANSIIDAVMKLAGEEAARNKITEKQAKARIASIYNYIIQLDKELYISSIAELSLNKSGSLVMSEVLARDENGYKYGFELPAEVVKQVETPVVDISSGKKTFKSRFK